MAGKLTLTALCIILGVHASAGSMPMDKPLDAKAGEISAAEPVYIQKNLLPSLGKSFEASRWKQRHLLNSTAYASLLALSIDASATFGKQIVFDPDSTQEAPVTVWHYIEGMNQRGYFEQWKDQFYLTLEPEDDHWYPFSQISIQPIPNGKDTRDAIKAAIDSNKAVVFTYNFLMRDASSREEFFRLKFNLSQKEVYPDDSSYDTLYDGAHTMCIVGYDDADQTFIVQESRSIDRVAPLPGLAYVSNKEALPAGLIKISQNLEYSDFLIKSDNITGAYRHEFFTLKKVQTETLYKTPLPY
jgi:hypothetical protein